MGIVGHFILAVAYALVPIAAYLEQSLLLPLLPLAALGAIILGIGWIQERTAFGPLATATGVLLLAMVVLGVMVGAANLDGGGDFAALGAIVSIGIVCGALGIATGLTAALAFASRKGRDGLAGRVAFFGHVAVAPIGGIALALGFTDHEPPFFLTLTVAAVVAAVGHAAGGVVFMRVRRS